MPTPQNIYYYACNKLSIDNKNVYTNKFKKSPPTTANSGRLNKMG